jgi:hypothetical protein
MAKFVLVESKGRGRPRENRGDKSGNVRVTVTCVEHEGNITRTFTVADARVSHVANALREALEKGRVRRPEKAAAAPKVGAPVEAADGNLVAATS